MATESDTSLLATHPWQPLPAPTPHQPPLAWHKPHIPYLAAANPLQYLDLYLPATSATPPATAALPPRPGPWVIYIHGGAWRDPAVQAASFAPTATALLTRCPARIAGLASLNYSLAPHPAHPDAPPGRGATHPQHILDVLAALAYVQRVSGCGSAYVLLGHSCGATLALQAAADHARWGAEAVAVRAAKPAVLVGLNGLYDLPALVRDPGPRHAHLMPVYEAFTRGAFGDAEENWAAASPMAVRDWRGEWPEGRRVVLVQSREDSLVPYRQTAGMLARLGETVDVEEMEAWGDHNALWEEGARLAEIVEAVLPGV